LVDGVVGDKDWLTLGRGSRRSVPGREKKGAGELWGHECHGGN